MTTNILDMTKTSNSNEYIELEQQILSLKRSSDLERGRSEVLRMVAQGHDIEVILNTLCKNAKHHNPELFCSILTLDRENQSLHPLASYALPKEYCDAIDGVQIGSSVGSCGTAAFLGKRVIVEDINTHPYWSQYKEIALSFGLQSCWSEPIFDKNGDVIGTFAIYYSTPKSPSKDDIQFIEVSANLAAVVFDNIQIREDLIKANNKLAQTVDQRTKELEQANHKLVNMLNNQSQTHVQHIKAEKMLTTKSLISGFASDISNPLSIALTAIGAAEAKLSDITSQVSSGQLKKTTLLNLTDAIAQAISINQEKLLQATSFLSKFHDININPTQEYQPFQLRTLFDELEHVINEEDHQHTIHFEASKVLVPFSKDALWQVIYQLIDNSIIHGFENTEQGNIFISGSQTKDAIIINYHDDGCGILPDMKTEIFEPFYSTKKEHGCTGLGLNFISNLLSTNLNGEIRLVPSPKGARFEITLSIQQ